MSHFIFVTHGQNICFSYQLSYSQTEYMTLKCRNLHVLGVTDGQTNKLTVSLLIWMMTLNTAGYLGCLLMNKMTISGAKQLLLHMYKDANLLL